MSTPPKAIFAACCLVAATTAWPFFDLIFDPGNEFAYQNHYYDGNKLISFERTAFMMYVAGVMDANHRYMINDTWAYCGPSGLTTGQAADVVRKWIDANPEERHKPAAYLIYKSLRLTFPCPAKR